MGEGRGTGHAEIAAAVRVAVEIHDGVPLKFTDSPQHPGRADSDIQQFSAIGTVEEQLREFQLFHQAGCSKFVIRLLGADTDDFLAQAEVFAKQIMPFIEQG